MPLCCLIRWSQLRRSLSHYKDWPLGDSWACLSNCLQLPRCVCLQTEGGWVEASWTLCLCKLVHFLITRELKNPEEAVNTFPVKRLISVFKMGYSQRHMLQYTGNTVIILRLPLCIACPSKGRKTTQKAEDNDFFFKHDIQCIFNLRLGFSE